MALLKVMTSPELVKLGLDDQGAPALHDAGDVRARTRDASSSRAARAARRSWGESGTAGVGALE